MTRTALAAGLLCAAVTASAQTVVHAPGGTLTGTVVDSATGRPVGYALVLVPGSPQRVFASESGRFTLTGIGAGKIVLRVQQIGYRGTSLSLTVDSDASADAGGLRILLARQPVVLPQIVVQGDVCSGAEALGQSVEQGTILDEAFRNTERLLTLEESYPFRVVFEVESYVMGANQEVAQRRTDTVRYNDSRAHAPYRQGKVLEGSRGPGQSANYITASDLSREYFQRTHCFWFAGRDTSASGAPGLRIEFAPLGRVKSADWAGSLLIDSTSMILMQSEAHLVNLDPKRTDFRSVGCQVSYRQMVPTLVLEERATCTLDQVGKKPSRIMEQSYLIRFAFLGKRPDAPSP